MAYRSNPFLERMAERTTSDQEFVRLFSPKILERLPEGAFDGALHIFRSPPGGGKTTLLRAFTPAALRAFWNARKLEDMNEAYQRLASTGVLDDHAGPQAVGVLLSCASGYADLPSGVASAPEGALRALLNCRIVLRTLRSVGVLLGYMSPDELSSVSLEYEGLEADLLAIPRLASAVELVRWAEEHERRVYSELDAMGAHSPSDMPLHLRFEGVLWLQAVTFVVNGVPVAPKRMLMIDDVHKLRRRQRQLLIEELAELRPRFPVWLAERSIALGAELLSQGVREGRDVRHYPIEEWWNVPRVQFSTFGQSVLDRRLALQDAVRSTTFSQCLRAEFQNDEVSREVSSGIEKFRVAVDRFGSRERYKEWMSRAERRVADGTLDALRELYSMRILLTRDAAKQQMPLDLGPLSENEMADRDSSQVQGAADIFAHEELGIPYYFGIERLCTLATNNIDELLVLAAALYDALRAQQILRRADPWLSPHQQEKQILKVARAKRAFIPKSHTEGTRAQRLLDAVGAFCRERTFLPNAPYAPGVTGVRLSQAELHKLQEPDGPAGPIRQRLQKVLAECVAENLLVARPSAASTSRESGTIFYLNRTMCANFGLPLQMGGWQDVAADDLGEWMDHGRGVNRRLEIG
jgi:hypothetical protein